MTPTPRWVGGLAGLGLALLTAHCTGSPTPQIIIVTGEGSPAPISATRSPATPIPRVTLPPEFTPTPSPTPTLTPTASPTPTITPTPDAETVCATFTWNGDALDGQRFQASSTALLQARLTWPDTVLIFRLHNLTTGQVEEFTAEGGQALLFDLLSVLSPGEYRFGVRVASPDYLDICAQEVGFTLLAGDPTPSPDTAARPTATPTETVGDVLLDILRLIRDRLREGQ